MYFVGVQDLIGTLSVDGDAEAERLVLHTASHLLRGYQSFKSPPTTPNASAAISRDNGESAMPLYKRVVLFDPRNGVKFQMWRHD